MLICGACGQENPEGFRFCGACARPLVAQASDRREERKVVTVLFCDLVGSTARAERLDPEDVRAALSHYHTRVRHELERFGGTVEKFIGDAVMALFGAPFAHEDDPERAVRAALAIRGWATEEPDVQVRVGVTTGEALVAVGNRPELGEAMASGDVVNTAARLEAAAPVNGILVDERTYRASERAIEYREQEAVTAKGKAAPVVVWEAVAPRSRLGVDVEQAPRTRLLGRERELGLLQEAFERAREAAEPQLVTLVGVPGIGKSRAVYELSRIVEADPELITWRQGRCLPYGEGVSFWALVEMVKAEAGILESDAPQTVAAKLTASVSALVPAADVDWVERWVRPLVGLGGEATGGHGVREESFPAWRRYLECVAERGPAVLVFEDLHWADEGLLDFLDELAEWTSGVPLLILCTSRPELLSKRPGWGGGRTNALTLSLRPLSADETAQLVHHLLQRVVLPADVQQALVERSGGNPLYAEEFARMLQERGASELTVPETVQGIIAARLDALGPEHKRLLQDAAVVGKVFWAGAVAALGGAGAADLEQGLHELERREFVRRERRSSFEGEVEYAFRHVLVRDVAYGQIPRVERSERHRAAADWITSLGRPDDHAELLAHHYLEALEYARAAGLDTVELGGSARAALRDAGERAYGLGAFSSAARYFRAALELAAESDPERGELLFRWGAAQFWDDGTGEDALREAVSRLRAPDPEMAARAALLVVRAAWLRGDREAVDTWLLDVGRLVADLPDSVVRIQALVVRSGFHLVASEYEQAIAMAREALTKMEGVDRPDLLARIFDIIGTSRVGQGDAAGLDDSRRAIEIARVGRATWEFHHAFNNLGVGLMLMARVREADALHEQWRKGFEEIPATASARAWFAHSEAFADYHAGRWDAALEKIEVFLAGLPAGSTHILEASVRPLRALIALGHDRLPEALADAKRAAEVALRIGDPQSLAPSLCARATVLLAASREDDAVADFEQMLALGDRLSPAIAEAMPDFAWVGVDLRRVGDARSVLDRSVMPRWAEVATAILDGDAATAADLLADIGDVPAEAYARLRAGGEHVRRALELYRHIGASRYVRYAEALLPHGRDAQASGSTS
jgi:class 3 adenylate cyclase/tetratricopeptide (TPR) repeat protein